MASAALTGAQKARLRGLGQRLDAAIKVGKEGVTPALVAELRRQLRAHELVKLRFLGAGREDRARLCGEISRQAGADCIGSVGQTALFYAPGAGAPGAEPGGR